MKLSDVKDGMKVYCVRATLSKEQMISYGNVIFGIMFHNDFIPAYHEWIKADGDFTHLTLSSNILSKEENLSVVNMGYVLNNKFIELNGVR